MRWLAKVLLLTFGLGIGDAESAYTIRTVAGSDWVGDGGPAIQAMLQQAEGLAVDAAGNLYIADAVGHRVRMVTPGGVIRTVAGTGVRGFSGDGGRATEARLNSPYGLAIDSGGSLFIADLGNGRVRRLGSDGRISTVAAAPLLAPRNLAVDAAGTLYVSDFEGHRIYKTNPTGTIIAVAGTGGPGFANDGGPALSAELNYPTALAVDRDGALYIADSQNHAIRKVSQGSIRTVARVATPTGMAADSSGSIYVADASGGQILRIGNGGQAGAIPVMARDVALAQDGSLYASSGAVVRHIQGSGLVTIVAGGGDGRSVRLNRPSGVAADAAGNVYIADTDYHRVRRLSATGEVTNFTGTGEPGDSGDGGPARQATLNKPTAVSVDLTGNVYIVDSGNRRVRMVTAHGQILPVTNSISASSAISDASGTVYLADEAAGAIIKLQAGLATQIASGLKSPRGLALDADGNLYFAEPDASRVRMLTPDLNLVEIATGAWKIPRGVAVDTGGNVYVADTGLQQILRVNPVGQVSVIAGTGSAGFSGDGSRATLAELGFPWDIAAGPEGRLYIADLDNNRVRMLEPATFTTPNPIVLANAVNAASMQAGPVAPGMLLAILDAGLKPGEVSTAGFWFGNLQARVINEDSVVIETPINLPVGGSAVLDIRVEGVTRASIPLTLAPSAPALFPVAFNEDGSRNSVMQPAMRGSIVVMYGTGLGVAGLPVSAWIGGQECEVLYAGSLSGYPGVFQLNLRVPDVVTGASSVLMRAGDAFSQAGVAIEVR